MMSEADSAVAWYQSKLICRYLNIYSNIVENMNKYLHNNQMEMLRKASYYCKYMEYVFSELFKEEELHLDYGRNKYDVLEAFVADKDNNKIGLPVVIND